MAVLASRIARASSGIWAVGLLGTLASAELHACPVCHSDLGQQVRAAIFNGEFAWHLLVVALPFPLLALTAMGLAHWVVRR